IYATSASIVCINVNNGEILASANYPSYSMTDYNENYSKLASDERNPLFNRAFQGTYPPGSTFKPMVGAIGLTVGTINKNSSVYCKKYYDYYSDITFKCMHYHGSINVIDAISKSCNYFFFDVGRRTGISTINEYSKLMGYGVKTGVEIPEASGTLAGPAFVDTINATWNPGDTLQASIGQSYNRFTPLQLATATATIANGGKRYRSHLLREVRTNDLSEVVVAPSAEVVANTGISEEAIEIVKSGMKSAAFEGTASSVFSKYDLEVGGKTGTAENPPKRDNALFISFAPYKNSEIAIAINVEEGRYGYMTASVVKDIYDQYYFAEYSSNKTPNYNDLIY
ncbi:MAG: penicillin-binding transpeptidase domain-containing protein, partial [Acutalibacteraceae bacterium]